jgi:hypothetical protein
MNHHRSPLVLTTLVLISFFINGCGSLLSTPTATATSTQTSSPTLTPTPSLTFTPTQTLTTSPTATSTPTDTPTLTQTLPPTATPTPEPKFPFTIDGVKFQSEKPSCGLLNVTIGGDTYKPIPPDEELCWAFGNILSGAPTQSQLDTWLKRISLLDKDRRNGRMHTITLNYDTKTAGWIYSVPQDYDPRWLVVDNGLIDLLSPPVIVTPTSLVPHGTKNIAPRGEVTASSTYDVCFVPSAVVDKVIADDCNAWASAGELVGAWIKVTFDESHTISRIVLYDRPNFIENIQSGKLDFSDGSSVKVGTLPDDGSPLVVDFPEKEITWVKFTITNAVGLNIGLMEFEIYGK